MRFWTVALLALSASAARAGEDQAAIKKLIDQAVKAGGGADKVAKLDNVSWKAKGSFERGGIAISFAIDASAQAWDKYRLDLDAQAGGMMQNATLVLNGAKVWTKDKGDAREAPDREMNPVRDVLFAVRATQMLAHLQTKGLQLSHLGEVKVGTVDAVGLRISRKDRPDVRLFFDKKTYLPIKSELRLTTPQGQEIEFAVLLQNHKDFDGLKHYTRLVFQVEGMDVSMEVSDVQLREAFDASTFAKP